MVRILGVLLFLFVFVGCSPEDLVSDFLDGVEYEEYECYPGNAQLPPGGSNPAGMVTPKGYYFDCRDGKIFRLNADGTWTGTVGRYDREEYLDYWNQCKHGPRPPEEEGRWALYEDKYCETNRIQPGLYACLDGIELYFDDSGQLTEINLSGYVDFYDQAGNWLGEEYNANPCQLTED